MFEVKASKACLEFACALCQRLMSDPSCHHTEALRTAVWISEVVGLDSEANSPEMRRMRVLHYKRLYVLGEVDDESMLHMVRAEGRLPECYQVLRHDPFNYY